MMDHAAVADSLVSASDSEPGDREPENAVDGSDGTRWASGPASGLTDGEAWLRASLHIGLMAAQTLLEDFLMGNTGAMFGCLMRADKTRFLVLVRRSIIAAPVQSLLAETFLWVQREAVLSFSYNLSRSLIPRYISNGNFYHIYSLDGRIKDADHRVVHDVKNVGFALDGLYGCLN